MQNEEDGKSQFFTCNCFTTDNIFLKDYKLHVRFESEQQFRLDYQTVSGVSFTVRLQHTYLSLLLTVCVSCCAAAEEAGLRHTPTV